MKKFEEPILSVEKLEVEDMITTSNNSCDEETNEYALR